MLNDSFVNKWKHIEFNLGVVTVFLELRVFHRYTYYHPKSLGLNVLLLVVDLRIAVFNVCVNDGLSPSPPLSLSRIMVHFWPQCNLYGLSFVRTHMIDHRCSEKCSHTHPHGALSPSCTSS